MLKEIKLIIGLETESAAGGRAVAAESRFKLPQLDSSYIGREHEASSIAQAIAAGQPGSTNRSICLVAAGGMGKSCLALDVCSRLWQQGTCPGGCMSRG